MKRLFSALLAALVVFIAVGCDGNNDGSSSLPTSEDFTSDTTSTPSSSLESSSSDISSVDERYIDMVAREDVVLENMTCGRVFYNPASSTDIYCINISEETEDTVATLRSLQGLVARYAGGAIYLDDGSFASSFWMEYCSSEYGLYFKPTTAKEVVSKFAKYIKGAIVYSSDVSYEYTVAQNVAVQSDYLVATGLSLPLIDSALTNKPLIDIRGIFDNKKDAYNYVMENCMQTSSVRYFGLIKSGAPFSDYLYAVKALCFDFDFSESWEAEMLSYIIGRPDWNDTPYVFVDRPISSALSNIFSSNGFAVISTGDFANCTVYSSIMVNYNSRTAKHSNKSLTANKIYAALYLDASSMQDVQDKIYVMWNVKTMSARISAEFYAELYELAPPIAKWFMQNMTSNDMLISADLGCGSANLSLMDSETAAKFRENNDYFIKACGISVVSDGKTLHRAEEYSEMLDGMVMPDPISNITANMRFNDITSFNGWLSSVVPSDTSPMYFLIELPSAEFDRDDYTRLCDYIDTALPERENEVEFVLSENLLRYM